MQRLQLIHANLCTNQKVMVEKLDQEQIGIIYLNSPTDLNSLSSQMKKELCAAVIELDKDSNIKVIVILSKLDKIFCAGANIKELSDCSYESQQISDIFYEIHNVFDSLRKPLIMGVNGVALGGGFELALNGDIIIASEDAKLGLPELKLGVIPGIGGTQRLTHLVGRTTAMKYILTSDQITAQEALNRGIVTNVVKKEQLREECIKIAKRISEKSLYTLIVCKTAIKNAQELPLSQANQVERQLFNSLLNTQAAKEGIQAFIEKRSPNFRNI
ncbi:unnamed protein product [Paramecium pentaurelia]|uniref:Enoyl-CoA hydratase n=1 Tax=Paramecium pentaurelia TaxID=43138 RepID=A0A8S1TD30_9CILI|nr:unnamed protein product [Paramecium pentaurelia]